MQLLIYIVIQANILQKKIFNLKNEIMKKTIVITMLLSAIYGTAQFKLPSKNDIKKEVKDLKSDNKPKKSEDASSQNQTAIPKEEVNSPAKGQISAFWKQIEKMRNHTDPNNKQVVFSGGIQSAQMSLKNTKVKDANYDTSEMEKALKECQDVYNGIAGGKENNRELGRNTLTKLQMFFEPSGPFIRYDFTSQESDSEKIQRVRNNNDSIAKYKKLADKFLSEPYDKSYYDNKLKFILTRAESFQTPYEKSKWPQGLAVNMHHLEDPNNMWGLGTFTLIQDVKKQEAYFYAANVIYPNQPKIQKALEWCKKAVAQIGNVEEVLAKINKSEGDYLKKVKFPSAKVNDAALEAEFKKHFNAMKYDETITKVNIQSTDWTIDRNELTGVIVGRSKQAYIATKTPKGECYVTEFWIFQDYNGSGYGAFRNVTSNSFRSKLDCANIK
jgi:hypothetical protein